MINTEMRSRATHIDTAVAKEEKKRETQNNLMKDIMMEQKKDLHSLRSMNWVSQFIWRFLPSEAKDPRWLELCMKKVQPGKVFSEDVVKNYRHLHVSTSIPKREERR